jgi:hypothetical protein
LETTFYRALGASELLPRYAYLEPLIDGARVLEVGAVASTGGRSAAFLRERGARLVLAVDSDPELVERAQRAYASDSELRFRAAGLESLEPGAYDLVLVADGGPVLGDLEALDRLRSLAGDKCRVVVALRNPAGISLAQMAGEQETVAPVTYGRMLSVLRERWASVEVLTQSALFAYQLAPVAAGEEPELSVDGSLAEVDEAAWLIAVCGAETSGLGAEQSIVALPGAPLAVAAGRRAELAERLALAERSAKGARADIERVRAERAELELRNVKLADQLQAEREAALQERRRAREAEARAELAEQELRGLRERVATLEAGLAELERELAEARALIRPEVPPTELERQLGLERERAEALENRLVQLEEERSQVASSLEDELRRGRELEGQVAVLQASEREAVEARDAEAERARIAAAEAMTATARANEMASALEIATARIQRMEGELATVTALERAARERAEQAEAALAERAPTAEPAAEVREGLEAAERRAREAEEAWEAAEKALEEARARIQDLDEEAQVLEASLAEVEGVVEAQARELAQLRGEAGPRALASGDKT